MAHVLLMDDDRHMIAEQVREALLAPCYRVAVVATGGDGLRRVRAERPDVIVFAWTCACLTSPAESACH